MNWRTKLRAALRRLDVWVNVTLLAAAPYSDSIIAGVQENLPALAPYLPANMYKAVGFALVVFNILHSAHMARKAAKP